MIVIKGAESYIATACLLANRYINSDCEQRCPFTHDVCQGIEDNILIGEDPWIFLTHPLFIAGGGRASGSYPCNYDHITAMLFFLFY